MKLDKQARQMDQTRQVNKRSCGQKEGDDQIESSSDSNSKNKKPIEDYMKLFS